MARPVGVAGRVETARIDASLMAERLDRAEDAVALAARAFTVALREVGATRRILAEQADVLGGAA